MLCMVPSTHATRASQTQSCSKITTRTTGGGIVITEGPQQRAADSTTQAHTPRSVSSRGSGSGEGHALIPPRGVARVTRSSFPAITDAMHPPCPACVSHVRRATGTFVDSEMACHPFDDKDCVRLFPDDEFFPVMVG